MSEDPTDDTIRRLFDRIDRTDRTVADIKGEVAGHGVILQGVQAASIVQTDNIDSHAKGLNKTVTSITKELAEFRKPRYGIILSAITALFIFVGGLYGLVIATVNVRLKSLEDHAVMQDAYRHDDDNRERIDAGNFSALEASHDNLEALNNNLHVEQNRRLQALEEKD
jgi:hypothetical protein